MTLPNTINAEKGIMRRPETYAISSQKICQRGNSRKRALPGCSKMKTRDRATQRKQRSIALPGVLQHAISLLSHTHTCMG